MNAEIRPMPVFVSFLSRLILAAAIAAFAGGAAQSAVTGPAPLENKSADAPLETGDEIAIHSLQVKELADKTFRIDQDGDVNFPLAGVVHLAGSTPRQAETILAGALKSFYFHPDVEINVTIAHTDPVSVLGAVGTPGVYQMKGKTTLLEALSAAGGVRGDAGSVVVVTRQKVNGAIPHVNARQLASGESIVEIDVASLTQSKDTADNILIRPHDVISVPAAQLVYVIGDVRKAGGFALGGRPSLSVIQALALAEGFDARAAPDRARILRRGNGAEQDIRVDMKKILAGKSEDVILRPNDILFIPSSAMKTISSRTIETAIQIGTGIAIFHP